MTTKDMAAEVRRPGKGHGFEPPPYPYGRLGPLREKAAKLVEGNLFGSV